MYADIKDHPIYDWLRLGWCGHSFECRLFGVNKSFYLSKIAPLYKQCNDYEGRLLEGVMFDFLKQHPGNYSLRFKREPHFGGLEGSNIAAMSFSQDQDSLKSKLKRFIGNVIRTTMPFFRF